MGLLPGDLCDRPGTFQIPLRSDCTTVPGQRFSVKSSLTHRAYRQIGWGRLPYSEGATETERAR